MIKTALFFFAALVINQPSFAQSQKVVADKIVAQIGDKAVLQSDLDCYKNACDFKYSPCKSLEAELLQKLLAIAGNKYRVLNTSELNAIVNNQIKYFISQYISKSELEIAAGKSIDQIRQDIREPFKERMLADKMRQRILDTVRISHQEVKAFFDKISFDSIPLIDEKFEINQIVLCPKPAKVAEDSLVNLLLDWKSKVEKGQKKFDALARLYTQDPGSRETGGTYAVNRHDKQWDRAWFAAIWKLKVEQISPVVKSAFGFHIIQLLSLQGGDAVIRHILLIPSVSNDETKKTEALLDSIRSKITSGKLSFSKAAVLYNQDKISKHNNGAVLSLRDNARFVTIDELDNGMVKTIKNMHQGEVSKPVLFKDDWQRDALRIVFLKSKKEVHRENLKDDYDDISKQALEEKKKMVLQNWVIAHIANYNLKIDTSFHACANLSPWLLAKNPTSNL